MRDPPSIKLRPEDEYYKSVGERVTFLTVDPVTFSRGSPLEGFFTGAALKESSHRSLAATN